MATRANIIIDQGATFTSSITVTGSDGNPSDLSGYTGYAQMRKHHTSSQYVDFNVTLGGASGTITLELTADQTANIAAGRYVYDVELHDDSSPYKVRIIEGLATVTPEVTK
jgi:hypothetical protein